MTQPRSPPQNPKSPGGRHAGPRRLQPPATRGGPGPLPQCAPLATPDPEIPLLAPASHGGPGPPPGAAGARPGGGRGGPGARDVRHPEPARRGGGGGAGRLASRRSTAAAAVTINSVAPVVARLQRRRRRRWTSTRARGSTSPTTRACRCGGARTDKIYMADEGCRPARSAASRATATTVAARP